MSTPNYLPIRTVSEKTGVNAVTLRAWERRYGLIKPKRTPKGHRLYTLADIELINDVLQLVEQGVPISQVRSALLPTRNPADPVTNQNIWDAYQRELVAGISKFDETRLDAVYQEAMALYPVDVVTKQLLLPLLRQLGERWERTEGGVAEEHFFGVYMRNKLGARFHHRQRNTRGPRLLAACLPGEQHELGLLLFALAAHDRGYRLVLLGANTPLDQLATICRRTTIDAIVLSSSMDPPAGTLERALPDLIAATGLPVFVGGSTAENYKEQIHKAGAHPVGVHITGGMEMISTVLAAEQSTT